MPLTAGGIVALTLFVGLYLVLVTEWVHRAVAALLAAGAAIVLGLLTPAAAARALDLNTLILLLALMILVALLEQEGLFVSLAEQAERWGGGHPRRILIVFLVLVAIVSAFLPNVTVILMVGPSLISLAEGFC